MNPMDLLLLKRYLDGLYHKFDIKYLSSDPLEFVHKFHSQKDQEIIGLITASLAYGRVDLILNSAAHILSIMDDKPYNFIKSFDPKWDSKKFRGFVHRFNNGEDMACFIYLIKQVIDSYGSILDFFKKGYRDEDENIASALTKFVKGFLEMDCSPFYNGNGLPKDAGVRFFLPSPEGGSACKRLNLFLRWMVRRGDSIDFGIWKDISPSKLIVPLDTHVARISRHLGLTKHKNPNWRMAADITANLKKLDPNDPVKYDFPLCRLGIMNYCPKKKDHKKCKACDLRPVCQL